jgi:cytochrome c5
VIPSAVVLILKRIAKVLGILVALVVVTGGVFVVVECSKFDASMAKVYDVPVPKIARSTDAAALARGKHVAESIAGCTVAACHGTDFGGGTTTDLGPVGKLCAPNITGANLGAAYSDGELARLIQHGVKKDGTSVRMMPMMDLTWLPDSDVIALVSYLRTVPNVERGNGATVVGTLGKILDRQDKFVWDVARRIDHTTRDVAPAPEATVAYGSRLARLCTGCHGLTLSGGPLPGAPSNIPIPLDLTSDATGMQGWTFDDFDKVMRTGVRKNGRTLDPFMPIDAWKNFDPTEMHALWAYLQSLPPTPFGGR